MTARQVILDNPRLDDEGVNAWCKRLANLSDFDWDTIKQRYYYMKRRGQLHVYDLAVKRVVTDADDNIKTKVYAAKAEAIDISKMPIERVTHDTLTGRQWIKVNNSGITEEAIEEALERVIQKHPISYIDITKPKVISKVALHAIITDDHIGLDTNPEGIGLFPYLYDKASYNASMNKVFNSILKEHAYYGTFDEVVINNLGDLEDGWNGETTRGGHKLPQNMTNDETFELAVDSRLTLIQKIVESHITKKIILRIVTNSNHSASFAIIVAKAIKKICDQIYTDGLVEIDILRKFMEYRSYGDHCFILSHGKDKKEMKSGLPIVLDTKTVNFINSYIDHHDLRNKYKYIHVLKGDGHRLGVTDHKNFSYRSLRSFSPISNWIGTNFGDVTTPGYSILVFSKNRQEMQETHIPLAYKKLIA